MVTIIGLVIAAAGIGQVGSDTGSARRAVDFLTGPKFHAELDQPATGAWVNIELRPLLNNLAAQRRVSILLDRRLDPTVRLPIDFVNRPLKDGLQDVAGKVSAETSIPENVVYIGPPSAVRRLRTLVELRTSELQSKAIPEHRRPELLRRRSVAWNDLETPAEILRKIAEEWRLTIRHPEFVDHDLWGGCTLPAVTSAEALSLVLIQFDLTFGWDETGNVIDLMPVPDEVVLERRSRIKGRSPSDALKLVVDHFPDLTSRVDGTELVVRGTLEEHEAVAALLNPSSVKKTAVPAKVPLRRQTFSEIKFMHVPVRRIMEYLEKEGVVFVYDAAGFRAAGIDLDQEIDVELTKASADELLKAVFSPLKLSFEIDNLTVKLVPKK